MKKLLATACIGMLMMSCSKDELTEVAVHQDEPMVFTAQTEVANDNTRTMLDANRNILWTDGDMINIFDQNTASQKYRLSKGAGTTQGTFEQVPSDVFTAGTELEHYGAIYPYSEKYNIEKRENGYVFKNIEFPVEQYYVVNSLPSAAEGATNSVMPMVAVSKNMNLKFKNLCGAIKLQLWNEKDRSSQTLVNIKVTSQDPNKNYIPVEPYTYITGPADIEVGKDGVITTAKVSQNSTCRTITLNFPVDQAMSHDANNPTIVYIIVPAMEFPEGIYFEINSEVRGNTSSVSHSRTYHTKPCSIVRNQIMVMPTIKYEAGTWGSIDDIIIQ